MSLTAGIDPIAPKKRALSDLLRASRLKRPGGGLLESQHFATAETQLDEDFCRRHDPEIAPGPFIALEVQDTGQGMPQEVCALIFEPFFTTKPVGKGTGLGLAAVFGTVKEHRGIITVESRPGAGTTFRIFLPAALSAPAVRRGDAEGIISGAGRVLVVDDEPIMRDIARESLVLLGYEAVLAEDGARAVEIFQREPGAFALVLLDMIMPELNGRDTFLRLRQIDPRVKVLFSSGFTGEEGISDLMAMGAAGFVQKPYRIASLSVAVAQALGQQAPEKVGPAW